MAALTSANKDALFAPILRELLNTDTKIEQIQATISAHVSAA